MANLVYNVAKAGMQNGSINLDTDTIKILLVEGSAAPDADHDTVAAVLAAAAELACTGYTAGASSASRKTLSITVTRYDFNDRSDAVADNQTWTGLDDGSVIEGYLWYKHTGTDDASNIPIMFVDTATGLPKTTNGSDIQVEGATLRLA